MELADLDFDVLLDGLLRPPPPSSPRLQGQDMLTPTPAQLPSDYNDIEMDSSEEECAPIAGEQWFQSVTRCFTDDPMIYGSHSRSLDTTLFAPTHVHGIMYETVGF